jgi:hypothetical protein
MRRVGVGILFVSLTSLVSASLSAQVAVTPKGETIVSSRFGTAPIQVRIRTHELQNGTADKPVKPPDSACTMSRIPCSVVDGLDITAAGERVFVPRSVFADLADVNDASLSLQKSSYVLLLTGGDASETYTVKILFNRKRVTFRSVTNGEFPEHPLQETIYHLAD